MKKYIGLTRILFGAIILFAGLMKLAEFQNFNNTVLEIVELVEFYNSFYISWGIIITEIVLGIMIILNLKSKVAISISLIFIFLFTLIAISLIITDHNVACNCFGSLFSSKISFFTIIRNIFILIIGFVALKSMFQDFRNKFIKSLEFPLLLVVLISSLTLSNAANNAKKRIKVGGYFDIAQFGIERKILKDGSLILLGFFSPNDCPKCLFELQRWNNLEERFNGRLKILGIIYAKNLKMYNSFKKGRKIKFNTIYYKETISSNSFSINTPLRILIDSRKKIIDVGTLSSSEKKFNEFCELINHRLKEE